MDTDTSDRGSKEKTGTSSISPADETGKKETMNNHHRCPALIYKRDTYRRTGRGKNGFEMHYRKEQCSRTVVEGAKYCWQHRKQTEQGYSLLDAPWAGSLKA